MNTSNLDYAHEDGANAYRKGEERDPDVSHRGVYTNSEASWFRMGWDQAKKDREEQQEG